MKEDEFSKRYRLVASTLAGYVLLPLKRKCRFCQLDETNTTFIRWAHLISETLGENNSISYEECDRCNTLFSKYEAHLSKYFLPNLTMVGVKGKRRVPIFQSRTENNEETGTIVKFDSSTQHRQIFASKPSDLLINEENKTGAITFRKSNYRPIYIYKALVKYGLSLMPNGKISDYKNVYSWLIKDEGKIVLLPSVISRTLTNKRFETPYALLFEAIPEMIEDEYFTPRHVLIVCFANLVLQVTLPVPQSIDINDVLKKTAKVPIYPYVNSDEIAGNSFGYETLDFSSSDSVNSDQKMFIKFDTYKRNAVD